MYIEAGLHDGSTAANVKDFHQRSYAVFALRRDLIRFDNPIRHWSACVSVYAMTSGTIRIIIESEYSLCVQNDAYKIIDACKQLTA